MPVLSKAPMDMDEMFKTIDNVVNISINGCNTINIKIKYSLFICLFFKPTATLSPCKSSFHMREVPALKDDVQRERNL